MLIQNEGCELFLMRLNLKMKQWKKLKKYASMQTQGSTIPKNNEKNQVKIEIIAFSKEKMKVV
jgi:hypothetical protein